MRIPDWTPEQLAQPQELVDTILARRGGALLNPVSYTHLTLPTIYSV